MKFFAESARVMPLDLGASGFDEFSIVHAGRAGGGAGHAPEAGVEMADPLGVQSCAALAGEFHEVDAAAGRVHFFIPEDVRRADGQTKTAVDAFVDDFD